MRQWIIEGIGRIPSHRDRDSAFSEIGPLPRSVLLSRLEETVAEVDAVIRQAGTDPLLLRRNIQVYNVSALQAIYHVVEHFSYHLGQILYIVKLRTGRDLNFYEDLK